MIAGALVIAAALILSVNALELGPATAQKATPARPTATAEKATPALPTAPPGIADDRCTTPPTVRKATFRHKRSRLISKEGSANHRGLDLIASADDARQRITGKLAYGKLDKDIEDEDVEVFACVKAAWRSLGTARTDDDGRFAVELTDAARLGVGMRDLYVASLGDGGGAYFLALVAPRSMSVVVTDIDGTLTSSENGIIQTAVAGKDLAHRPGAPEALASLGRTVVYVTARGDVFAEVTRRWLERHGFPRGPLVVYQGAFARPGRHAVDHKIDVFGALPVAVAAGIGNRKSDIDAYRKLGVLPTMILIYLPDYEDEVRADLAAGKATGFDDYRKLRALIPL